MGASAGRAGSSVGGEGAASLGWRTEACLIRAVTLLMLTRCISGQPARTTCRHTSVYCAPQMLAIFINEGETLCQENDHGLLYCDTRSVVAIWNQTRSVSEVCPYPGLGADTTETYVLTVLEAGSPRPRGWQSVFPRPLSAGRWPCSPCVFTRSSSVCVCVCLISFSYKDTGHIG